MARLLTVMMLILGLPLCAMSTSWKVLDRSEKNVPEWIGSFSDEYIVVEVERPSLEEAQRAAEQELAHRIISAVAVNVTFDTQSTSLERIDDNTHHSEESFSSTSQIASARLPFMKGVSLARATSSYWELREDKKDKRRYVVLSVQYPLSKREIDKMHEEFVTLDKEKTREFEELKTGLPYVESSRDIQQAIYKLRGLQEYFFDNTRLTEAKGLEKSYRDLYKGISLDGEINPERKEAVVTVLLHGRPLKFDARPVVTSNCANHISVTTGDHGYDFHITYDDEDCLKDEENYLDVNLRIEGARLSTKLFF